MKKNYIEPEISVVTISSEDIMTGSDVYIDISDFFAESTEE